MPEHNKQQLSNIWGSIHYKVKKHWGWVEKCVAYKKKCVLQMWLLISAWSADDAFKKKYIHAVVTFIATSLVSFFKRIVFRIIAKNSNKIFSLIYLFIYLIIYKYSINIYIKVARQIG